MLHQRGKSITAVTAFQFTLLAAFVLTVMGFVIRASVSHHFLEQDQGVLEGKMALIRHALMKVKKPDDIPQIRQQLKEALIGHPDLLVRINDFSGIKLIATENASIPDALMDKVQQAAVTHPFGTEWTDRGVAYRALAGVIRTADAQAWTVVVAVDTQHHAEFLHGFDRELLMIGVGGLVLIAGLGWLATRRGLRPIQDMAHVAEGISAQRLHERLGVQDVAIELQPLARAFNEMLDRLGDSLDRLSDFSSDLAHELRTPINNLMTQTQVSATKLRSAEEYREILYSNLEEFDRLARMIEDMLFLAKADNGLVIPHTDVVDLRQQIRAVFEFYDALAAEKSVTLHVQGEARVCGDQLMLRRAISNLISNAVRHAHSNTTVEVQLQEAAREVRLSVKNTGETLPAEHLERLFDRFYRADTSRQRSDEGAGLGLAITRSIVRAHKGTVSVTSNDGMTRFLISLPV